MRIISGTAGGTNLKTPKGLETRPSADRVKESLFSVLTSLDAIRGKRVLDAFSGTGALALESLSRGAVFAVAVDKKTAAIIKLNAEKTHLDGKIKIYGSDISILRGIEENFDLIFSDPPYHKGLTEKLLAIIVANDLLSDDGIICAETGADETIILPDGLKIFREINYGKTTKIYLIRNYSQIT